MHQKLRFGFLIVLGFVASIGSASTAQSSASGARALVTQSIDERVTVVLSGNTRSEANALNDRGRVEDALPLEHMQLLLQRPPEMEAELNQLINELHDSGSPL